VGDSLQPTVQKSELLLEQRHSLFCLDILIKRMVSVPHDLPFYESLSFLPVSVMMGQKC
jgi:hypothetical protein